MLTADQPKSSESPKTTTDTETVASTEHNNIIDHDCDYVYMTTAKYILLYPAQTTTSTQITAVDTTSTRNNICLLNFT